MQSDDASRRAAQISPRLSHPGWQELAAERLLHERRRLNYPGMHTEVAATGVIRQRRRAWNYLHGRHHPRARCPAGPEVLTERLIEALHKPNKGIQGTGLFVSFLNFPYTHFCLPPMANQLFMRRFDQFKVTTGVRRGN